MSFYHRSFVHLIDINFIWHCSIYLIDRRLFDVYAPNWLLSNVCVQCVFAAFTFDWLYAKVTKIVCSTSFVYLVSDSCSCKIHFSTSLYLAFPWAEFTFYWLWLNIHRLVCSVSLWLQKLFYILLKLCRLPYTQNILVSTRRWNECSSMIIGLSFDQT